MFDPIAQLQGGKAALGDKDQLVIKQSALDESNALPGTLGEMLMATSAFLVEALEGTQDGHKRKGPETVGPRDGE